MSSSVAVGKHLLERPATAEYPGRKARLALESKKRDDAMFAELIGPSQERVYRLALRITRNTEDAEDVQQETLLKVHRKLGQFEGRARLTTWISRIAINEALMCLRKRRSAFYLPLEETIQPAEESTVSEEFQSPIEGPEAAYSRKELRELLKQAILGSMVDGVLAIVAAIVVPQCKQRLRRHGLASSYCLISIMLSSAMRSISLL